MYLAFISPFYESHVFVLTSTYLGMLLISYLSRKTLQKQPLTHVWHTLSSDQKRDVGGSIAMLFPHVLYVWYIFPLAMTIFDSMEVWTDFYSSLASSAG